METARQTQKVFRDAVRKHSDSLIDEFSGECAYCDSSMDAVAFPEIMCYRLKSKFPQLADDPTNLFGSPPCVLMIAFCERHGASRRLFSPSPAASAVPLTLVANTSGGEPPFPKTSHSSLQPVKTQKNHQKIVARHSELEQSFVEIFIEQHATPPREIVLDLDA